MAGPHLVRFRRASRFQRAGVTSAAIAAMLCCGSCAPFSTAQAVRYCAIMPDSVGLYVDNPVTQMGYPIGKIAAITPQAMSVRVDFTVEHGRVLPEDVRAVSRSASMPPRTRAVGETGGVVP